MKHKIYKCGGTLRLKMYFFFSRKSLQRLSADYNKWKYQKKIMVLFGNFAQHGGRGGGLPDSQNFCKYTKSFLVYHIHSEALKHAFHTGGGNISSILSVLGPRQLSPGAQLSVFGRQIDGPRTVGLRGPTVQSPTVRGPKCLEPIT